jgi:hypothetical protein
MNMRRLPLRDALWDKATARLIEGQYLPGWAKALRAVLFPRELLGDALGSARHWAIHSDTWTLYGTRFHGKTLRRLALSNGELYRVNVEDGAVRISTAVIPVKAPGLASQGVIDVAQIVYALQRAERQLQWHADELHKNGDYAAEGPAEDAERMREAIALLLANPTTTKA